MSRDVDENAKITVNAKALHDVLHTFDGSASRAFDSLVREFNAWLQSGETVEVVPEPLTVTVTGPRSCRTCGWTLPEQFTGYYGACPVCLLIASGQEELVVTEAVLRRYCEKNGCVIYAAPKRPDISDEPGTITATVISIGFFKDEATLHLVSHGQPFGGITAGQSIRITYTPLSPQEYRKAEG